MNADVDNEIVDLGQCVIALVSLFFFALLTIHAMIWCWRIDSNFACMYISDWGDDQQRGLQVAGPMADTQFDRLELLLSARVSGNRLHGGQIDSDSGHCLV